MLAVFRGVFFFFFPLTKKYKNAEVQGASQIGSPVRTDPQPDHCKVARTEMNQMDLSRKILC